jgi:ABC-type cobalamin transport system permease subunit
MENHLPLKKMVKYLFDIYGLKTLFFDILVLFFFTGSSWVLGKDKISTSVNLFFCQIFNSLPRIN